MERLQGVCRWGYFGVFLLQTIIKEINEIKCCYAAFITFALPVLENQGTPFLYSGLLLLVFHLSRGSRSCYKVQVNLWKNCNASWASSPPSAPGDLPL